ncbi:hypothetical protein H6P81_009668 [Aristolochia fimbriata]|uniref:Uncharacterized protein n=1 Tax=Aristolochia fimbriata TaxID=158543 RepID=A0AAV7ER08_ARIFI|nr:hypothetical protein H6P81_009668 [Aristolochia fimbriata]
MVKTGAEQTQTRLGAQSLSIERFTEKLTYSTNIMTICESTFVESGVVAGVTKQRKTSPNSTNTQSDGQHQQDPNSDASDGSQASPNEELDLSQLQNQKLKRILKSCLKISGDNQQIPTICLLQSRSHSDKIQSIWYPLSLKALHPHCH